MNKCRKFANFVLSKQYHVKNFSSSRIREVQQYFDLVEEQVQKYVPNLNQYIDLKQAHLDWNFLLDSRNKLDIEKNYLKRNGIHKTNRPFPVCEKLVIRGLSN